MSTRVKWPAVLPVAAAWVRSEWEAVVEEEFELRAQFRELHGLEPEAGR